MRRVIASLWNRLSGLSARLLLLTVFFVMLSEVLIYCPSIARFRLVFLDQRIAAAHLASLALEVPPDNMVSDRLREELLAHAGSYAIVLHRPASKALMLSHDMPPTVDQTVDLRDASALRLIYGAFRTLASDGHRYLRVIGVSPRDPKVVVETVISERPLRLAMLDYSGRILALSIVISLITASLVYFSLQWLFVRPLRALTAGMVAFREDPEDGRRLVDPSGRADEIGVAQRELADMQRNLRAALLQKARLAALGTAVTKINHDLRNILATAQLVSDRLADIDDPQVQRVAPTLLRAIDRAVALCSKTLRFVREGTAPPEQSRFGLRALVEEAASEVGADGGGTAVDNRVPDTLHLHADRDQIDRVLCNLLRNAREAGATRVEIDAAIESLAVRVEIADNGPGLPARVRGHLFEPFAGAGRSGGTGLGLSIARDLMRGHGGDIELAHTGPEGTAFRLVLPVEPPERAVGHPAPTPDRPRDEPVAATGRSH